MRFIAKFINARMPFSLRQTLITRTIDCGYKPQFNRLTFTLATSTKDILNSIWSCALSKINFILYNYGAAS